MANGKNKLVAVGRKNGNQTVAASSQPKIGAAFGTAACVADEWATPGAARMGMQFGGDNFKAIDDITIVSMSRDYKRRLGQMGDGIFREAVASLRMILWTRLKTDFPEMSVAVNIILPRADFGIIVGAGENHAYANDQRVLQKRLDDACQGLCEVLGM